MEMRDQLEEKLAAHPFAPFILVMSSGARYEVSAPGLVALGSTIAWVARPSSDRMDTVNLRQLTAIEQLEAAA
jgi:hypothetical protein